LRSNNLERLPCRRGGGQKERQGGSKGKDKDIPQSNGFSAHGIEKGLPIPSKRLPF